MHRPERIVRGDREGLRRRAVQIYRRRQGPGGSATSSAAVVAIVLATLAAGCGEDVEPPTAVELAGMLITPETFADVLADDVVAGDDPWTMNVPTDQPGLASGVVPDEALEFLPRLELCPDAGDEAIAAAEAVRWSAFRQLDLDVADPIEPPNDRTGHLVFVQEYLTTDEVDVIEQRYDLLSAGLAACLGDIAAGEEGPGSVTEMAVPDLGDERYGVLMVIEEAGAWAEWRLHQVLVREGPILALLSIADIRADTEPLFSDDDLDRMFELMADRIDD
ncbi:MAG: hypothetical protein ACO3D0_05725 [Ilumatobacteraceae bacterium]